MELYKNRAWVEISLSALLHNLEEIKKVTTPGCKIVYVIKADAYGCGAKKVCGLVENKIDMFAVATADEALELRDCGMTKPILILGPSPLPMIPTLADRDITQSIFSVEYALQVKEALGGRKMKAHIMIDSGMSRLGFYCHKLSDCDQTVEDLLSMYEQTSDCIEYEGVYSHFAVSDSQKDSDVAFTEGQFVNFMYLTERLKEVFPVPLLRHCCNSASVVNSPEKHLDMIRPGIILYGCMPSGLTNEIDIRPVASIKACISQLRTLRDGDTVSYGRNYTAQGTRVTATIPIGYADGFPRNLTGKFDVIVNGKLAHSAGNVCMDQLCCDVTGIEGVKAGQVVTLIGKEGDTEIRIEDVAALMGTIANELITNMGPRLPRIYVD